MPTTEQIANRIVEYASRFLNLYEVRQNKIWDNPATPGHDAVADELVDLLKSVGWQPGWAYCMALAAALWIRVYKELGAPKSYTDKLHKSFNCSSVESFNQWKKDISLVPLPGSIFFMRRGDTPYGHAGIVVGSEANKIKTIEGNTSAVVLVASQDYEGDGVFRKVRSLDFSWKAGLYLRGFLHPKPWSTKPEVVPAAGEPPPNFV